ncbi:carbon-nitrogen hydrolase [Panaeolus papilionaceus]|nr:carbon-nitrogen hydrolase [Panaeolus papilionaceus]
MPGIRQPLNLRIGVVQFAPRIGHVQSNIAKARELCKKIQRGSLDVLCFPEMAFTGYVFENTSAISPHLEYPKTGPTSQFCAELARSLGCYVTAGYPEKLSEEEIRELELEAASKPVDDTKQANASNGQAPREQIGANSAVFYNPQGELLHNYRKTNLFVTDLSWAKAGTGFKTFSLPPPIGTVTLGICNDLNPQTSLWSVLSGPFELSAHALEQKTNVFILLNAWLDSKKDEDVEHDWSTLNYWASRMRPLWSNGVELEDMEEDNPQEPLNPEDDPEMIVVVCNRTGEENGKLFSGSSAIFSMRKSVGRPKLLDMMERDEEGVKIWQITV